MSHWKWEPNPYTRAWGALQLFCFIMLAIHLGWSWWLVLLVFIYVQVEFRD